MTEIKILWIDDDFAKVSSAVSMIVDSLHFYLKSADIMANVTKCSDSERAVFYITEEEEFDLILLDLTFTDEDNNGQSDIKVADGYDLLTRLKKIQLAAPVIILSHVLSDPNYSTPEKVKEFLIKYEGYYMAALSKETEDIKKLAVLIEEYFTFPPVSLLVLSDLHISPSLPEKESLRQDLLTDVENLITSNKKFDHLVVCGDFTYQASVAGC